MSFQAEGHLEHAIFLLLLLFPLLLFLNQRLLVDNNGPQSKLWEPLEQRATLPWVSFWGQCLKAHKTSCRPSLILYTSLVTVPVIFLSRYKRKPHLHTLIPPHHPLPPTEPAWSSVHTDLSLCLSHCLGHHETLLAHPEVPQGQPATASWEKTCYWPGFSFVERQLHQELENPGSGSILSKEVD